MFREDRNHRGTPYASVLVRTNRNLEYTNPRLRIGEYKREHKEYWVILKSWKSRSSLFTEGSFKNKFVIDFFKIGSDCKSSVSQSLQCFLRFFLQYNCSKKSHQVISLFCAILFSISSHCRWINVQGEIIKFEIIKYPWVKIFTHFEIGNLVKFCEKKSLISVLAKRVFPSENFTWCTSDFSAGTFLVMLIFMKMPTSLQWTLWAFWFVNFYKKESYFFLIVCV